MAKKLITLVIPVFNEEENIDTFYTTACTVIERVADCYDFEFVFTDNHSSDATYSLLSRIASQDPRVRVYRFSRNFGYQRSILTGYKQAQGDAAIQMDCDLQDPPEMVLKMLEEWERGYQVVYGVRRNRKESWYVNMQRWLFYRIIDKLSEDPLPLDAGDFRLVDRKIIDQLTTLEDSQPYLRGTIAALGFKQLGVPYDRGERKKGTSKFSWGDYLHLSIDGVLNHSTIPLRFATYTGLLVSTLTFAALVFYGITKIIIGKTWPAGFATTTTLILLSLSLNALFLGIIGEYLGRIYKQVKKRPLTILESSINHDHSGQ